MLIFYLELQHLWVKIVSFSQYHIFVSFEHLSFHGYITQLVIF